MRDELLIVLISPTDSPPEVGMLDSQTMEAPNGPVEDGRAAGTGAYAATAAGHDADISTKRRPALDPLSDLVPRRRTRWPRR